MTYLANLPITNASKEFKVRSPTFTRVAKSFFTGDKVSIQLIIARSARPCKGQVTLAVLPRDFF